MKKKPPKETMKNCFNYKLQDDMDTLKHTLETNKESEKAPRKLETAKRIVKDQGSVSI